MSLSFAGSGHIMSLKMADSRYGNRARLNSHHYLNTTGLCIEFFFCFDRDPIKNLPFINVLAFSEERKETKVANTTALGDIRSGWNKFFAELPSGLFQVVLEGVRSSNGPSGISIDDVLIRRCSYFSEYDPPHMASLF